MVHRCCISSCGMNVRVAEAKGLSYHGFPNKEPLREQWIQAIIPHLDKPEIFKVVPKYTRICSRHFRKKDYSVDIKKRARLNVNAVPSVFPRKNSPLVIPNILSTSPRGLKSKSGPTAIASSTDLIALNVSAPSSLAQLPSVSSDELIVTVSSTSSPVVTTVTWTIRNDPGDGTTTTTTLDTSGLPREFLIESATLTDDQLTLTVLDSESLSTTHNQIVSNESQQDPSLFFTNDDSNDAPYKKRKRRKWNRSAFDRPPKGKKKISSEDSNVDGVGEALAEISLSNFLSVTNSEISDSSNNTSSNNTSIMSLNASQSTCTSTELKMSSECDIIKVHESSNSIGENTSVPPESVQQLSTIEQELLQSIQAVSLHCGEPDNTNSESRGLQHLVNSDIFPPFIHHHSSEESLFSNEDDLLIRDSLRDKISKLELQSSTASSTSQSEVDLMAQIVGVGLEDDRIPTVLEIDNLANHFNSSLLTTSVPITLSIGLCDLNLPSDHVEEETSSTASTSLNENNQHLIPSVDSIKLKTDEDDSEPSSSPVSQRKKKADDVRLTGVTKKHKKEKFSGRFSVERFSNSDKDIEYYTGFTSYRNFEAFFRSLEAYVERLRVTDVMFGVTNLDKLHSEGLDGSSTPHRATSDGQFLSPLPPPPALDEPQKRRPFHGRSMTRIDELFMTVIRLKRKLPEKVLGHMFCISQPTVSRIIRAWTVLLSKLIDCYPVESTSEKSKTSKVGGKVSSQQSYTSRGLGIPESFRQLFHCELAKSIVVTSVTAKDKKISSLIRNSGATAITKRSKKSRSDETVHVDLLSKEESSNMSSAAHSVSTFCVDLDESTNSNATSSLIFNLSSNLEGDGSTFFQSLDFL